MQYLTNFFNAAKGKLTTYVALVTAGLNELLNSWDAAAALLPHWLIVHKVHIVSAATLLAIWSRVRRLISPEK